MDEFDLLTLATGPAASRTAVACSRAGWHVGIVDPRPFGGTCALRGCNPKKVFVRAAELYDAIRRFDGNGVRIAAAAIDWPELLRFKRTFTDPVTSQKEAVFRDAGITLLHGSPKFVGPNWIMLGDRQIHGRRFVVATGAVPAKLGIPGEQWLAKSDEFLDLEQLPHRIVFVGGGYISCEFAHIAARAGAQVTDVEAGPRPLSRFDADLVDRLMERSLELGIEFCTSTTVESVDKRSDGSFAVRASAPGQEVRLEADLVVHGAGRVPNVANLDLNAGEVKCGPSGIDVNEYLQSLSNSVVYAAGDVAASGAPPLAPVANVEGRTVARNLLEGNHHRPDYRGTPTVVFTVPALAAVGLSVEQARETDLPIDIRQGDRAPWNSMRKIGERYAHYKIISAQQGGRILGAHLLGPDASETINLFALAIRHELTVSDLKSALFAVPTFCSDVRSMF
jgi:glutathione reductase (NADPH)